MKVHGCRTSFVSWSSKRSTSCLMVLLSQPGVPFMVAGYDTTKNKCSSGGPSLALEFLLQFYDHSLRRSRVQRLSIYLSSLSVHLSIGLSVSQSLRLSISLSLSLHLARLLSIIVHMRTHTHTHTYIHTYIQTYIHTYIHTYMHTYIHAYIHAYLPTRTYIHT